MAVNQSLNLVCYSVSAGMFRVVVKLKLAALVAFQRGRSLEILYSNRRNFAERQHEFSLLYEQIVRMMLILGTKVSLKSSLFAAAAAIVVILSAPHRVKTNSSHLIRMGSYIIRHHESKSVTLLLKSQK